MTNEAATPLLYRRLWTAELAENRKLKVEKEIVTLQLEQRTSEAAELRNQLQQACQTADDLRLQMEALRAHNTDQAAREEVEAS